MFVSIWCIILSNLFLPFIFFLFCFGQKYIIHNIQLFVSFFRFLYLVYLVKYLILQVCWWRMYVVVQTDFVWNPLTSSSVMVQSRGCNLTENHLSMIIAGPCYHFQPCGCDSRTQQLIHFVLPVRVNKWLVPFRIEQIRKLTWPEFHFSHISVVMTALKQSWLAPQD